jgi:AcrR family transcriptional regulator
MPVAAPTAPIAPPRAESLTGRRLPSERVAEMQRAKILAATLSALDEGGFGAATVSRIVTRARVSRTAFYSLFSDRDECLTAILDRAMRSVENEFKAAQIGELPWAQRVRSGLRVILEMLDREPALARAYVVEAAQGGELVLAHRAAVLRRLALELDAGRTEHDPGRHCTEVLAEGLVGGVLAIVHSHLLRRDPRALASLAPELTHILLAPYLPEQARPEPRLRPRTLRSLQLAGGRAAEAGANLSLDS